MKFSEAMLKGFEQVNGRQCTEALYSFVDYDHKPVACCVLGAIQIGRDSGLDCWEFNSAFACEWGIEAAVLNDKGMAWEHIYGMAVAAGL